MLSMEEVRLGNLICIFVVNKFLNKLYYITHTKLVAEVIV